MLSLHGAQIHVSWTADGQQTAGGSGGSPVHTSPDSLQAVQGVGLQCRHDGSQRGEVLAYPTLLQDDTDGQKPTQNPKGGSTRREPT